MTNRIGTWFHRQSTCQRRSVDAVIGTGTQPVDDRELDSFRARHRGTHDDRAEARWRRSRVGVTMATLSYALFSIGVIFVALGRHDQQREAALGAVSGALILDSSG